MIYINDMNTPSKRALRPQSSLRAPLNRVLGTETHVRIIRGLDALAVPVPVAELARYIQMDKAGVWRAISILEELGVVDAVGIGTQQGLQLRKHYPLYRYLTGLFQAERNRFEKLIQALTEMARRLKPSPRSVWIEGPVAARHDQPEDPIIIGLLADSSSVGRIADTFRGLATGIQKQFDVAIEVRPRTTADLATMDRTEIGPFGEVILLLGPPPAAYDPDGRVRDEARPSRVTLHKQREDESLLLARMVSDKIRRDPTLIKRAHAYLRRRLAEASPREAKELHEWRGILQTYSRPQLRRLLTDRSERGIRLRQSSPFLPALSQRERQELLNMVSSTPRLSK
jgi:hypothetical protein